MLNTLNWRKCLKKKSIIIALDISTGTENIKTANKNTFVRRKKISITENDISFNPLQI